MLKKILFFFYENWKIYTAIILTIITFLSLYPLNQQPSFPGDDKLYHLLAYSFLTICLGIRKPPNYILILIFLSFYSGLIEIIQPYLNRFAEIEDFIFNNLGLIIGFVIGVFVKKTKL